MGPVLGSILSAGIPAVVNWASQMFSNRSARKEYDKARDYNTPANQMARFKDAGLSPWLAYGQANSGNVSGPRPAQEAGGEHLGKGMGDYIAMTNFDVDLKNKWMQYWNLNKQNEILGKDAEIKEYDASRKRLDLISDYPGYVQEIGTSVSPDVANAGFRRKFLELKRATSEEALNQMREAIQSLKYKNVVEGVKARYAEDYGMVGGDWTQGMGLLKSIPNMFKKSRAVGKSVAPWNSTIKTNPILNQRLRRRASRGAVNP